MWRGALALLVLAAVNAAHAETIVEVPQGDGTPVLIDGKISDAEWRDAAAVAAGPSLKLHVKQFKGHVFIAVKPTALPHAYVDMFLVTGKDELFNLHASMQIGERLLTGADWADAAPATRWGNHVGWIASESKVDPSTDRELPAFKRLLPSDGVEFQLERARFAGNRWRIRLEVRDFAGESADIVFPGGSTRKDATGWSIFVLGGN